MNIREKNEKLEEIRLIKEAQFSSKSLGRLRQESQDDIRSVYMVDRDRIIHSKSFRRLKHKTQVFVQTSGDDHYRTRLTHTIEVSQIARTISVGIGLNEYLVEAIAMGHDLGHVAFAHIGEEILDEFLDEGFRHNEQSVRVVKYLEKEGNGLNLTAEVIDGILKHSGLGKSKFGDDITLEGQVVRYSDKIAYLNHDIDDSIRAGLLHQEDIPKTIREELGETNSQRIDTLVRDMVYNTIKNISEGKVYVSLSEAKEQSLKELRKYMFDNVYLGEVLKDERKKARFIVENVIDYYFRHYQEMPSLYIKISNEQGIKRGVADYIAGMSDDYCLNVFRNIYMPKTYIF